VGELRVPVSRGDPGAIQAGEVRGACVGERASGGSEAISRGGSGGASFGLRWFYGCSGRAL
jgi:hypothetical protein